MSDLMIDFDALSANTLAELDIRPHQTFHQTVTAPAVIVSQGLKPVASKTHLTVTGSEQWTWQQLRDYVVSQIEAFHGPQPRNPLKEKGIFSAFLDRWGNQAPAIARAAFEVHQGFWHSAPISVNRFCKSSDQYFAQVISERL